MSEWERVRLDEVVALDVEAVPVEATASYDIVGVLNRGRGLLYRDPLPGSETSYKTLNLIRPDQIVYSRLKAFEGAITVAPSDLPQVYASQEFPTFTCGQRLLPSYFKLLTATKSLWDDLKSLSTGMGGRRERVKPADFLTIRIPLPSMSEQNRIVDVMAAVDAEIEALSVERKALDGLRRANLGDLQTIAAASPQTTLGDFVKSRGGSIKTGPFGTALKAAEYSPDGVPVISTGEVRHGFMRVNEKSPRVGAATLARLPQYTLAHGDIVFARKGAVDRSAWVKPAEEGYFLGSDGLRVRTGADVDEARFIAYLLQTDLILAWLSNHATGTIMKGLNQKILATIPLGFPDGDVQRNFVSQLDSLDKHAGSMESELAHLRAFRSALLISLLNREIEIPESYDSLLEEAS
ncbi:restriction endonuclease subunit S [[Kitasatospora] papulosa]|uniref:restriction endonuclease subunit S n=1 Tax=[Kitasatospora] papulosa TaxID=1464011 RepID=UPI0036299E21